MYRKVQAKIENWIKEDSKHALLVTGARQIGKTYIIREALNNLKCDYIEINFIENPSMTELFSEYTNVKDFELRLSLATNHKLQPGKTIIFFDEVQEVKDIITMSKFLVQDTPYKYVMSGSLLGVEIKDIRSVPVGYMRIIDMYPMDLSEFYRAVGVGADIIKTIENAYINRKTVDEFVHKRLMSIFNIYLIVGGMPEAVKKYIDTNDLRSVAEVQSSIIELYKEDFSKYNKKEKLILNEIYDAIPGELNEKNKRYYINHVEGKVKFDLVKNNFLWLSNAGVAIPVCNVTEAKTPLQMSEKRSLFKLFLSDVGMLTNMFPDETKIKIINGDASINNGAIFENYVAQELKAHGYKVYYYNSKKQGEVDFVIEHDGKVLPIEVKSGKDYKKHSALNNLLENDEYKIGEAIVLSNANVSNENGKIYLPIYMTMFLEEKKMDMVIKPDLTGLNGKREK